MKKILLIAGVALLLFPLMAGCQREVTVIPAPQQQPSVIVNPPQQPGVIVVPGRPCPPPYYPPPRPGIHIDINSRPGYQWCNRCGVWVQVGHPHHCR